jgi:hypothetical protein
MIRIKPQEDVYISFLIAYIDVGEVAAVHANITVRRACPASLSR